MNNRNLPGLYVHVPFCRTKCPYCDFYSTTSLSLIPPWLEAVQQEVRLYSHTFGVFDSLYLGGGTPSLLAGRQLGLLLSCLRRHFSFSKDAETTIEVNPDDVNSADLSIFSNLGINRISIGVQSFNENELRFLGRRHSADQTLKALDSIRAAGFNNLGLDLMYGLPNQTKAACLNNLESALLFKPEHISCYQLTMAKATPFGRMRAEGQISLAGEREQRDFFIHTSRYLEKHGYTHYEVSNFARDPVYFSHHNRKYWRHAPYLGLGPSAHSFLDDKRWWNVRSVEQYIRALAKGNAPMAGREELSSEQLKLESLFLGLRTKDGIDLDAVAENTALDTVLAQLQRSRHIEIHDGKLIPTRKGFLIADSLPLLLNP
jgi:putative oxygen-independent coproporphyrinogen III oxidase